MIIGNLLGNIIGAFFQRKAAQDIPHLEIQRYFDSVEKDLSNPGSPMCIESESTRFFNHNTVQQAVSAPNNGIWKDLTSSMVSWYGPFGYPRNRAICFLVLPCQYFYSAWHSTASLYLPTSWGQERQNSHCGTLQAGLQKLNNWQHPKETK